VQAGRPFLFPIFQPVGSALEMKTTPDRRELAREAKANVALRG
jgi:hypothetical protein